MSKNACVELCCHFLGCYVQNTQTFVCRTTKSLDVHTRVLRNHIDFVRKWLDEGNNVDMCDKVSFRWVMYSIMYFSNAIVQRGQTLLHVACLRGNLSTVAGAIRGWDFPPPNSTLYRQRTNGFAAHRTQCQRLASRQRRPHTASPQRSGKLRYVAPQQRKPRLQHLFPCAF